MNANATNVTRVYGPSASRMEEIKESRKIVMRLIAIALFCLACGTAVTLGGLKLVKYIMGVENFGFPLWTWLGIHFAIFWVGVAISVGVIGFILFFLALLVNLDRMTIDGLLYPRKPLTKRWVGIMEFLDSIVIVAAWAMLVILDWWVFNQIHPHGWVQMTCFIIACIMSGWPWAALLEEFYSSPFDRWLVRAADL